MISILILVVTGGCLCLLLAYLMNRLLWPAVMATLIVGAVYFAYLGLLLGTTFLSLFRLGVILPFVCAAVGAAIAALATAWVRRRRAEVGGYAYELEEREQRRKKARRILLILCPVVVLMLIAGVVVFRIVLSRRVERELNEIRAKVFPVTLEELNAWYPQPPAGQNAATPYLKALAVYVDAKSTYVMPQPGEPLTPEMKKLLEAYVANNRETLKLLHEAAAMPLCRFPVDFTKVCEDPGTRVGLMGWLDLGNETYEFEAIGLCRLLAGEAILDAENGRATEAADATVCMLGLGRAIGNEPFITTQTTRVIFQMLAASGLQRTLSGAALSDEDLGRIDDLLKDAVNFDGMTRTLAATRCMGSAAFTNRKAGAAFAHVFDEGNLRDYTDSKGHVRFSNLVASPISWRLRFLGLLDMDHLVFLRWTKTVLADWQEHACKGGLFEGCWLSNSNPFADAPAQAFCCNFTLPFVIGLPVWPTNFTRLIPEVELARSAIAVERYRNGRGVLPEELSELVPEYLPAVPLDPWDGKPLRYKKLDKGFVIYSVGRDRKDDGGISDPERGFNNITFRVTR